MDVESAVTALKRHLGENGITTSRFRDNDRVHVEPEVSFEALRVLKEECGFDFLVDIVGVDYLNYPDAVHRYGVVYALLSTATGKRLFVKTHADDPEPRLKSVWPLWRGSDWMEREVFDMFGVRFDGHPDLRRILLPEEFTAHPLRKDYPVRGRGERHAFEVITRAQG